MPAVSESFPKSGEASKVFLGEKIMQNLDQLIGENAASVNEASNAAGQYLASINKVNLENFTDGEWNKFLTTIIKAYIATAVPF